MDLATRKKISQTMKGHSNFEGHKHTHATKIQIGFSQEGHRNAKDHKWVTDKESGQERRVKGNIPKGMRKGRTRAFSQWIHAKEEKEVWDKPNPKSSHDKLSPAQKAKAKARAKAAGRPYPNMVDNIWAARNEEIDQNKPENREIGSDSLAKIYAKNTPGQTMNKSKLNEMINRYLKEKKDDVPFDGPYTKAKPDNVKDKSGAVHTPMSRARHLARMALAKKKLKEEAINELSKATLSSYANDAALDAVRHGNNLGRAQLSGSKKMAQSAGDKITKRLDGVKKAISKIQLKK